MFQTQVTKPPHSRSNDLHLCDAIRCSDRTLEAFFTDGIQWTPIRTPEEDHPPTSSGLLDVKMSTANDLKPATSTSCASSVGYFSANSSLSSNVSLTFDRDKKTIQGKQTQATIASQINEHNTSMKMVASVTSTSASSLSLPASADNTMQPRSSSSFSKSATSPPQQQHQTSYQFRCQQHLLAQHSSDHNFHHHQHHHFESSHQVSHNESNEHQHLPQTSQSVSSSTSCTAPTSMLVMNGTAMSLSSVQPLIAMRRVMLLYENLQHEEAANFVLRLNESTFALVARELPIGLFIEQMPQSLHVLEALYAKLLLGAQSSRCALSTCPVYAQLLKTLQPESVTMHLVKLFALRTQTSHVLTSSGNGNSGNSSSGHHNQHSNNEPSVLHCTLPTPFADRLDSNQLLMLTIRKLLRAILQVQPAIRKQLAARKRAIDGAIDALGHHGLVSVSGGTSIGNGDLWSGSAHGSTSNVSTGGSLMLSLQDAIRLECEQLVQQQRAILNKLDQTYGGDSSFKSSGLSSSVRISKASGTLIRSASVASAIVSGTTSAPPIAQANGSASSTAGSVCNKGTLPVGASHQRQLSLRPDQIQNRLLRNKQLLNSLEQFTGGQQSLQLLMQMLDARIQYDKETLFQFAQLRKEFNYCCTVSRRLCGALLGNAGVSTLDGAHSCMNATGSTSSNGSSNNSNGSGGHSSSRASGGSNAGQSSGSSPSGNNSSGSNGHAIVTNHVMGCCIESNAVVAPVLMRFSFGCAQVLQLFDQVSSEVESSLATSLIGSAHAINECPKHSSAGIVFDDCNGNDHNNASTNVPPTEFCSTDNKDDTSSGNDTKQLSTLQQKIISNETTPTPSSNTSTTMIRCNETVIHRTKDGNEIQCEPIKTGKT